MQAWSCSLDKKYIKQGLEKIERSSKLRKALHNPK
jgi:hypothetical protein